MGEEQIFQFCSSAHLERLTGEKAYNLDELLVLIEQCTESTIFYHTFSALRKLRQVDIPYTNDFATWIYSDLGLEALAEKLGAIDLAEYNTLESLRARILAIVRDYRKERPAAFTKRADEAFYLFDVIRVVYLTDKFAYDLRSFRETIESISADSLYFHFIESRTRTKLHVDDFSMWIEQSLNMPELAAKIRDIDISFYTLDGIQKRIGTIIDSHLNASG